MCVLYTINHSTVVAYKITFSSFQLELAVVGAGGY